MNKWAQGHVPSRGTSTAFRRSKIIVQQKLLWRCFKQTLNLRQYIWDALMFLGLPFELLEDMRVCTVHQLRAPDLSNVLEDVSYADVFKGDPRHR